MVMSIKEVTEMLSMIGDAYERSKAEGLAVHIALLHIIQDRLLAGSWQAMSLPAPPCYTEDTTREGSHVV